LDIPEHILFSKTFFQRHLNIPNLYPSLRVWSQSPLVGAVEDLEGTHKVLSFRKSENRKRVTDGSLMKT